MICQDCGSQMVATESSVSCPECHPRLDYCTVPCGITTEPCPECAQLQTELRKLRILVAHMYPFVLVYATLHAANHLLPDDELFSVHQQILDAAHPYFQEEQNT